jgi:hypothetical protein
MQDPQGTNSAPVAEGSGRQQAVAEHVEPQRDRVDADLRAGGVDVEPERPEQVVAEEATAVRGLPRPVPQPQLERGQRAVRAGEVDAEDRQGHRGVEQQKARPPEREQRAGQHEQDGGRVQEHHRRGEQHH